MNKYPRKRTKGKKRLRCLNRKIYELSSINCQNKNVGGESTFSSDVFIKTWCKEDGSTAFKLFLSSMLGMISYLITRTYFILTQCPWIDIRRTHLKLVLSLLRGSFSKDGGEMTTSRGGNRYLNINTCVYFS